MLVKFIAFVAVCIAINAAVSSGEGSSTGRPSSAPAYTSADDTSGTLDDGSTPDRTYCPDAGECRAASASDPDGCLTLAGDAVDADPVSAEPAGLPADCRDNGY